MAKNSMGGKPSLNGCPLTVSVLGLCLRRTAQQSKGQGKVSRPHWGQKYARSTEAKVQSNKHREGIILWDVEREKVGISNILKRQKKPESISMVEQTADMKQYTISITRLLTDLKKLSIQYITYLRETKNVSMMLKWEVYELGEALNRWVRGRKG